MILYIAAKRWILIDIRVTEKSVIVLDPMIQYVNSSVTLSESFLQTIDAEINTWAQKLQGDSNATFARWDVKPYHAKCPSFDVVIDSCDTGVAVLSCIQYFENDLIPLYHVPDLAILRKKIYFNILNGEFPAV